ncbi:hypothetical protein WMY93_015420 [Mugilogobius chulae]|uniref:Uncharacterized protein n=1 Tax=Mugilogobius chulae TaxID=88201 RepID=A0AAW0NWI4_9GOBI
MEYAVHPLQLHFDPAPTLPCPAGLTLPPHPAQVQHPSSSSPGPTTPPHPVQVPFFLLVQPRSHHPSSSSPGPTLPPRPAQVPPHLLIQPRSEHPSSLSPGTPPRNDQPRSHTRPVPPYLSHCGLPGKSSRALPSRPAQVPLFLLIQPRSYRTSSISPGSTLLIQPRSHSSSSSSPGPISSSSSPGPTLPPRPAQVPPHLLTQPRSHTPARPVPPYLSHCGLPGKS